ncbi:hypothetical protein NL460_13975 [Klebsiella pneumoniae]|nr:hypothetical protein [Klebsiella pneumoniae]
MTTDITELAQSLKAEDISSERMEWLKKLADMEYCANNPGHWLMNLKETNYLASLALQCLESNSTLVEALEKAQQRISQLESRTVKLPDDAEHDIMAPVAAYLSEKFKWDGGAARWDGRKEYDVLADRVKYALRMVIRRAAGIKVEAE